MSLSVDLTSSETYLKGKASKICKSSKYPWEIDSASMVSKGEFSIRPDRLIERSKEILDKDIGKLDPDDLAEDFTFQFPVIGPLTIEQYLKAIKSFNVKDAFPDSCPGLYDFRVDPFEPNRVWFTGVFTGTHTGTTKAFGKPTGRFVMSPPQTNSLIFNAKGEVVKFTGGYVMDRFLGNTGGLGGLFGPLYAVGRGFPFPEGKPYQPSLMLKVFNFLSKLLSR
jgi:hypothetical protein